MKKPIIALVIAGLLLLAACKPTPPAKIGPELEAKILKASRINNFEYTYADSDFAEEHHFFIQGKNRKVVMNGLMYDPVTNQSYNEIFYEVFKEMGFGYCSKAFCSGENKDMEAVQVDYTQYDHRNPAEWLLALDTAKETGEEALGNINTRIIQFTDARGNTGAMWVHSFDYVPMKVEYTDTQGKEHSILFKDIYWNVVRDYHTKLPIYVKLIRVEKVTA